MFNEHKVQLQQTTEELKATSETLAAREETLQMTAAELDSTKQKHAEQSHLVQAYSQTEQILAMQAAEVFTILQFHFMFIIIISR